MTDDKRKTEPPLKLDMNFGEALNRFVATKPQEVAESVERSKTKRPPQDDPPRRPALGKRENTALPDRKRKPGSA
jgi:hypothetical protein